MFARIDKDLAALNTSTSIPKVDAKTPVAQASATPASTEAERGRNAQEEQLRNDWPNLTRYQKANADAGAPAFGENRVIFYGDSITDAWITAVPDFFLGKPYLDRGISGQTTPQMVVRFRQDVVDLKPKVVIILAGTNDIAGNTGPSTPEMIQDNFRSMVEIARANGIQPVLASVLPASDYPWKPGLGPGPKIAALNSWIKSYAQGLGIVYLDYYSSMVNDKLGLPQSLSSDGVHPNTAGYAIMGPLAERSIAQALKGTSKGR
jgi:acyl-CoA thioesterase-1